MTQGVHIIGSSEGDGILFISLAYERQCLNHQPCGGVGVFHGERRLLRFHRNRRNKCGEGYFLGAGTILGEGKRVGHLFLIGKERQIVLLTIAEVCSFGKHAANIEILTIHLI